MTGSGESRMQENPRRLSEAEVSLLMATAALALAGREPCAVVLTGDSADRTAALLADVAEAICPGAEVYSVGDAARGGVGGAIRAHPPERPWERPIGLLVVDGPRDRSAVSRAFPEFEPSVVAGGYVAFGHYDSRDAPDVTDFVNELLEPERYQMVQCAGTVVVVRKAPPPALLGDPGPDRGQTGSRPAVTRDVAAGVLAATADALRETLERTAWIERRSELVDADRLGVIRELRTTMEERTGWAERMTAVAEQRGAVIDELQAALGERTAWAKRMVAVAEQRGAVIDELQAAIEERTAWAERMAEEAERRLIVIQQLQAALEQRPASAEPTT